MKRQNVILIHIILWLVFVLPINCTSIVLFKLYPELIWSFYPEATLHYVLMDALYNCISFACSFYLSYFFVFKWLFRSSNLKLGIGKVFGLFIIEYVIELWVLYRLYADYLATPDFLVGAEIPLFGWLLFRFGIAMGVRGLIEYINERAQRKQLEIFNIQSELSLFRAQVNPHFLFNTLNNIDALIHTNPNKASETLIQLSKQMRYLLYDSNVETIDLTEEIRFIKNYIDLESIRIKNKNFVNFEVIGNSQGIRIAPMLFITFVENAFKHRSDKQEDKGLNIRFSITRNNLLFICENNYDKTLRIEGVKYNGIGLELVKKRLNLIYEFNYELSIKQENNCYAVQLSLPLKALN